MGSDLQFLLSPLCVEFEEVRSSKLEMKGSFFALSQFHVT